MSDQRSATQPATVESAHEPVTLARRFVALFADWILCLLVAIALGANPNNAGWQPVAVLVVEYTFFIGFFTQTPGMFIAKLRCVSVGQAGDGAEGARIGPFRAALRGLLLALVIPALVMDANRRGWHDRVAGSIIVPAARRA